MIKRTLEVTTSNSNNKYSPFYDPKYTMSITINGQLSLTMLMEKLVQKFNVKMLMLNTDGLEFIVKREYQKDVEELVSKWEKHTGLQMEGVFYSDMYIADVNSYIAIAMEEN